MVIEIRKKKIQKKIIIEKIYPKYFLEVTFT